MFISMKKYKLEEHELDLLLYGSNEHGTANQYLKFLSDSDFVKKLSLRKLNKYIDTIVNSKTNGFFIGDISDILIKRASGFQNYKFINEYEICEVN